MMKVILASNLCHNYMTFDETIFGAIVIKNKSDQLLLKFEILDASHLKH